MATSWDAPTLGHDVDALRTPTRPAAAPLVGLLALGVCLVPACADAAQGSLPPASHTAPSDPAPAGPEPRPWRESAAECGLTFRHARGARGDYRLEEILSGGVALFDAERDGDLDVFLAHGEPNEAAWGYFLNDGDGTFQDAADEVDATPRSYGMGVAAADCDGDGATDLLVTCVGPDVLLVNDTEGGFRDGSLEAGIAEVDGFSSSAVWFDADLDGDLDLYVARYVDRASPEVVCRAERTNRRDYCNPLSLRAEADLLYRNDDGRLVEVSDAAGVGAKSGYGLAVLASDVDRDGWTDVYVANDQTAAFLWRNAGSFRFEDVASARGCAYDRDGRAIAGMGVVAEDFDGDLDLDLFVTNIRTEGNVFFRNDGVAHVDASGKLGQGAWLRPYTGFGVAAFDQDHDGALDVYVTNGAVALDADGRYVEPDSFARFDGRRYVDASAELGPSRMPDVARCVASGDLDGDGDLDLLIGRNGAGPLYLRNEAASDLHWLQVSVEDARGNPILNARVEAHAAGRSWVREVRAQDGYLGSRDPRVHFGLGAASALERLVVHVPSAAGVETRQWTDVSVDRLLTVTPEGLQ